MIFLDEFCKVGKNKGEFTLNRRFNGSEKIIENKELALCNARVSSLFTNNHYRERYNVLH